MLRGNRKTGKIVFLLILVGGFAAAFMGGYRFSGLLTNSYKKQTAAKLPPNAQQFLPGKYFFEDVLLAVTKTEPRITLQAIVTRLQNDNNFSQDTTVSFFDGNAWTKSYSRKLNPDSTITGNDLIKKWEITLDPSRVLKQTVTGEIGLGFTDIDFATGVLQNEIGVRSLPGHTRFLSNGNGTLVVNKKEYPVHILYTRYYSINAQDIGLFDKPKGIRTDWVAFWDAEDNFYLGDSTRVEKPTSLYVTHGISVAEDAKGFVAKAFDFSISEGATKSPAAYTFEMKKPIDKIIRFRLTNRMDKNPQPYDKWVIGNITGTVEDKNGKVLDGMGYMDSTYD